MEYIDVWCKCFFGFVDKENRRMCAYSDKPWDCSNVCPNFITKREANDICKQYVKEVRCGD